MRVFLNRISDDIADLVRAVLHEIFGDATMLQVGQHGEADRNDVVIWDYQAGDDPGTPTVAAMLLLVERKDLPALEATLGGTAANIILKPLQPGTLAAFLRAACSARRSSADSAPSIDSMRNQRDQLLQGLMEANVRLQEYDQDRTNFLMRAVHDFRAPLTAITGYCGLLVSGQLGPLSEKQRTAILRMRHSALRLSRLSEGILDLSIGARTDRDPALKDGDLRDCVEHAIRSVRSLIEERALIVSVDLSEPAGQLVFDASRMEQVCSILADNACRFSPRGGHVEITGYSFHSGSGPEDAAALVQQGIADCYRVDFRDAGPEITSSRLADVFEENTSYSAGYDRSGPGLGLATCRMIIVQHGGRIWAENSGSGAAFSFILPFAAGFSPHTRLQAAHV